MRITKTEARKVWEAYHEAQCHTGIPLDASVEIYRDSNHCDVVYHTMSKIYIYEVERMLCHATKIHLEPREGYRILDFHTGAKTRLKVFLTDK
jgi:hypothetical protein